MIKCLLLLLLLLGILLQSTNSDAIMFGAGDFNGAAAPAAAAEWPVESG